MVPGELLEMSQSIRIVFDGPPGPEAGRFVEVEDHEGRSIRVGHWRPYSTNPTIGTEGWWALDLELDDDPSTEIYCTHVDDGVNHCRNIATFDVWVETPLANEMVCDEHLSQHVTGRGRIVVRNNLLGPDPFRKAEAEPQSKSEPQADESKLVTTCPDCGGYGFTQSVRHGLRNCTRCERTGRIPTPLKLCTSCHGTGMGPLLGGQMLCAQCNGSGRRRDPTQ